MRNYARKIQILGILAILVGCSSASTPVKEEVIENETTNSEGFTITCDSYMTWSDEDYERQTTTMQGKDGYITSLNRVGESKTPDQETYDYAMQMFDEIFMVEADTNENVTVNILEQKDDEFYLKYEYDVDYSKEPAEYSEILQNFYVGECKISSGTFTTEDGKEAELDSFLSKAGE